MLFYISSPYILQHFYFLEIIKNVILQRDENKKFKLNAKD